MTKEAKNKRLLLATHYAQMRRATEVRTYEAIKTHLEVSNLTLARDVLDLEVVIRNKTIYDTNASEAYSDGSYMLNENITAMENKYELNHDDQRELVPGRVPKLLRRGPPQRHRPARRTDRAAQRHVAVQDELQNACYCPRTRPRANPRRRTR